MWNENSPKNGANYVEYAKELKRVADGCGVVFNHMPDVKIHIVPGEEQNKKITFKEDISC